MIDWLVKRLTPYRASVERWASLASSTQEVWETHVDPALSRLERLRSYYQADYQDLSRLIREMGDYFAEDLPGDTDRPIAVSWRRMELEYKDLELILSSVFRRHFGNLPVTWFPIFAPIDEPYGVGFKVAEGPWPELKNIPPADMFLTSRGRLGVDHGHLLKMGLDKATFLEKGIPLLRRTKPLHIVYDGPLWYIYFDLPFHAGFLFSCCPPEAEVYYSLLFAPVGSRFDFIPADERPVDTSVLQCTWESESRLGTPVRHSLIGICDQDGEPPAASEPKFLSTLNDILAGKHDSDTSLLGSLLDEAADEAEKAGAMDAHEALFNQAADHLTAMLKKRAA